MILGLDFGSKKVSGMAIPKTILIGVIYIEAGPKYSLDLYINSFLYKFFKTIKLLGALLYFGP